MKNILFLLVILFLHIKINAQEEYKPLILEGNQWNVLKSKNTMVPEYNYDITEILQINGDTIVDGIGYKKLYKSEKSLPNLGELIGFVREELNDKKVYLKLPDYPESLIYDFNVSIGDIIHIDLYGYGTGALPISLSITSVDNVSINGEQRKKVEVRSKIRHEEFESFGQNYIWVEGIGGDNGLITSIQPDFATNLFYSLLCFYQNEKFIYKPKNSKYEECFIYNPPLSINAEKTIPLTYFIESKNNTLHIFYEEDNNYMISLINLNGQILFLKHYDHYNPVIDISQIPKGIYILQLKSYNFDCSQKVIIKQ